MEDEESDKRQTQPSAATSHQTQPAAQISSQTQPTVSPAQGTNGNATQKHHTEKIAKMEDNQGNYAAW